MNSSDPAGRQEREPGMRSSRAAAAIVANGAGIATPADRLLVRVVGDDRVGFFHGICSNDFKRLAPGEIGHGLILTEHAHVIADFFVYVLADSMLLEVDRGLWSAARAHLERFLVADDVEFEELAELGMLDIEGPRAASLVAGVAGDAALTLEPWRHLEAGGIRIANLPRYGATALTIIGRREEQQGLAARLLDYSLAAGLPDCGEIDGEALEALRIEHGLARIGRDTGEKTLALEARLEPAISFSKGCYLGQETIERATARGGLKKRMFGLKIEGDGLPAPGSAVSLDGKEVGRLTSVARSAHFGAIGLSILHHSAWQPGTTVAIDGPHRATVVDLPFA